MGFFRIPKEGDKISPMSAPSEALACPIRDQLVSQFKRRLDHYTQTFTKLLGQMTAEKASAETKGLYDSCVEAREALHDHERKHGCLRD